MFFQLDLRREERERVIMPGGIRYDVTSRTVVTVADLSTSGCRIDQPGHDLALGSIVFVRLDHLAPLRARVRWNEPGIAGLEFEQPLYIPVLNHLLNRWRNNITTNLAAI